MEIVGVRFNEDGKVYYFNPNGLSLKVNLTVIVNTEKGIRFGKIVDIKESDNVDSLSCCSIIFLEEYFLFFIKFTPLIILLASIGV